MPGRSALRLLWALWLLVLGCSCAHDAVAGQARFATEAGVGKGSSGSNASTGGCSGAGLLPFHERLSMHPARSRPLTVCPTRTHATAEGRVLSLQGSTPTAARRATSQLHAYGSSTAAAPAQTFAGELAVHDHKSHDAAPFEQQQGSQTASGHTPGFVGVYVGWLAQSNMGDEIVADLFLDLFVAALIQATDPRTCISVVRSSQEFASRGWRGCNMSVGRGCDFAVLGGGSTGGTLPSAVHLQQQEHKRKECMRGKHC